MRKKTIIREDYKNIVLPIRSYVQSTAQVYGYVEDSNKEVFKVPILKDYVKIENNNLDLN